MEVCRYTVIFPHGGWLRPQSDFSTEVFSQFSIESSQSLSPIVGRRRRDKTGKEKEINFAQVSEDNLMELLSIRDILKTHDCIIIKHQMLLGDKEFSWADLSRDELSLVLSLADPVVK